MEDINMEDEVEVLRDETYAIRSNQEGNAKGNKYDPEYEEDRKHSPWSQNGLPCW